MRPVPGFPNTGSCGRTSLDRYDVLAFVDEADDAARRGCAPDICGMRGEGFVMRQVFHAEHAREPSVIDFVRELFCSEAGEFSKLRQYVLERNSIEVDVAPDRRTATVVARYTEKLPYK